MAKYYIVAWIETKKKYSSELLVPVYLPESECSESEKSDDDFLFEGELDSPEFEQHFNDNICIPIDIDAELDITINLVEVKSRKVGFFKE